MFFTGIKGYMVFWMTSIILAIAFLMVSLVMSIVHLNSSAGQMFTDAKSLEASYMLEQTILSHRREDLLWRITRDAQYRDDRNLALKHASEIVKNLDLKVTTDREESLVDEIEDRYLEFRKAVSTPVEPSIALITPLTDSLLDVIHTFRAQNKAQMELAIQASRDVDTRVTRWSVAIVFVVVLIMAVTLFLARSMLGPVIELSRVARQFGDGSMHVRVRIFRNDEMGKLCEIFNTMADDIAGRVKDRRALIGSIVHDIKNPLVVIGGAARMMLRKGDALEWQAVWLENITKQVKKLDGMIGDAMDVLQAETGLITIEASDIDLAGLARAVFNEYRDIITTHKIICEAATECMVIGDPQRLERVLVNILTNAVKYSPEHSAIRLQVTKHGASAVLTVQDSGAGIAPENMKIIFEPFTRLSGTKMMAKGFGMGLFTVKKIIEAHCGTISIQSMPGTGTTVSIYLPLI